MDKIRRNGDRIKEKYSKPCCIKVSVGVGVGLLLLIVVIVAATVATGGGSDSDSDGDSTSGSSTAKTDSGSQQQQQPVVWQHKFGVQLESQNFAQELAIDDATQTYVIEISSNAHYNLYIIVDFRKKEHRYVGIEKSENSALTNVVEKKVLFCHRSSFDVTFNGEFVSAEQLRNGDVTYREQMSGRTVTLDARYVDAPYTLSPTLATIVNGSCDALSEDQIFHWSTPLSYCGDNTTLPSDNQQCTNLACPQFPKNILSTRQACSKFRECNHYMFKCDSFWATSNYDNLPYCVCRKTIVEDMDNINCPAVTDDGGECEIPKRDVTDFESFAPCHCRYRISRIYPVVLPTSRQTVTWMINAFFTTAPANNFKQCSC